MAACRRRAAPSCSEQPELVAVQPAHLVVIECHAAYPAISSQSARLRLDFLRGEHALHRLQQRIARACLAAGVLFLCLLPSTVQSSIAFTSMAKGRRSLPKSGDFPTG